MILWKNKKKYQYIPVEKLHYLELQYDWCPDKYFYYHSMKTYVMGTHQGCLAKALWMSTQTYILWRNKKKYQYVSTPDTVITNAADNSLIHFLVIFCENKLDISSELSA